MPELTHKDLQSAAKNINAVFELKPQIKTIASRPNLESSIKDALAPFVASGDNRIDLLEETTISIYNELVQPNPLAEVAAEMAEEDEELETAPAGEGEGECPVFGQEFDASAPECMECARAEECAPLTKKPKADKPKADKPKKYGRMNAFSDVLAHNIGVVVPRETVIAQTDARYVEAGGVSNLKESAWIVRTSIRILILLGIVEESQEGYKYLGV
jgi:hypothetical protein